MPSIYETLESKSDSQEMRRANPDIWNKLPVQSIKRKWSGNMPPTRTAKG